MGWWGNLRFPLFFMKKYRDYILEREGKHLFETEKGFLTYSFESYENEKAIYIQDIYVLPEFRKHNIAAQMADVVAKKAKEQLIHKLIGSVDIAAKKAEISMQVLLAYGMRPYGIDGNVIFFVKDI